MSAETAPADGAAPAPLGARATLGAVVRSRWFAYGMLALLQLRVVWGIWDHRDLSSGDSCGYFMKAFEWFSAGRVDVIFSPLYTMYYGSLMFVTQDPYAVTLLHRLAIAFAAGQLVLAVLRRLLPPAPAWLAAAWWTVLPINFDTLYEVHLFAVLPPLAVWLLLLAVPGRWARGGALATLCAAVVLLRNEMAVAAGLFACACAVREWRARRAGGAAAARWRDLALAYGAPLAAAAAVCVLVYSVSSGTYREQQTALELKHTVNMGQVFAYGYKQRHPECACEPWGGYGEVMTEHFGEPRPALSTMLRRNPRAVAEHFLWNWELAPNGLQVLLFNATSGKLNPDYAPVNDGSRTAEILSVLLLACWLAGGLCLVREWRFWWSGWLRERAWGWVGMLAVAAVALPVITTQRPRPSYLFALSIVLMAVTATAAWVLAHRLPGARRLARGMPLMMVAVVALTPAYYRSADESSAVGGQRLLHDLTERLLPYEGARPRQGSLALTGDYHAFQVAAYVWKGRCVGIDYGVLERDWPVGTPLERFLAERDISVVYLNDRMLRHLESRRADDARAFLTAAPPGWQRLGGGDAPGDRWRLFVSPDP